MPDCGLVSCFFCIHGYKNVICTWLGRTYKLFTCLIVKVVLLFAPYSPQNPAGSPEANVQILSLQGILSQFLTFNFSGTNPYCCSPCHYKTDSVHVQAMLVNNYHYAALKICRRWHYLEIITNMCLLIKGLHVLVHCWIVQIS